MFASLASIRYLLILLATGPLVETPSSNEIVNLNDYDACGQVALYSVCKLKRIGATWEQVRDALGVGDLRRQHSLDQIITASVKLGLSPVPIRVSFSRVSSCPTPSIVHLRYPGSADGGHYVVLLAAKNDGVWILDPPYGHVFVPSDKFNKGVWSGEALFIADSRVEMEQVKSALSYNQFLTRIGTITNLFVASLTAVVFLLVVFRFALQEMAKAWKPISAPIALVLLLSSVYFLFGRTQTRQPHLSTTKSTFDLGRLSVGSHDVKMAIANKGSADLLISKVVASCSCAVPQQNLTIPPGETRDLRATIDASSGNGTSTIAIHSNDPSGVRLLKMSWSAGESKAPVFFPPRVVFRGIKANTEIHYQAAIYFDASLGTDDLAPRVESIDCAKNAIRITAGKFDRDALVGGVGCAHQRMGRINVDIAIQPLDRPGIVGGMAKFDIRLGEKRWLMELPVSVQYVE